MRVLILGAGIFHSKSIVDIKDAGFEVTDKIILYLSEDVALVRVFEKHQAYIQQETLTTKIVMKKDLINGEIIEFDQIKTIVNIEKV